MAILSAQQRSGATGRRARGEANADGRPVVRPGHVVHQARGRPAALGVRQGAWGTSRLMGHPPALLQEAFRIAVRIHFSREGVAVNAAELLGQCHRVDDEPEGDGALAAAGVVIAPTLVFAVS